MDPVPVFRRPSPSIGGPAARGTDPWLWLDSSSMFSSGAIGTSALLPIIFETPEGDESLADLVSS
eukprot:4893191-Prymnesium_polylepis.1